MKKFDIFFYKFEDFTNWTFAVKLMYIWTQMSHRNIRYLIGKLTKSAFCQINWKYERILQKVDEDISVRVIFFATPFRFCSVKATSFKYGLLSKCSIFIFRNCTLELFSFLKDYKIVPIYIADPVYVMPSDSVILKQYYFEVHYMLKNQTFVKVGWSALLMFFRFWVRVRHSITKNI